MRIYFSLALLFAIIAVLLFFNINNKTVEEAVNTLQYSKKSFKKICNPKKKSKIAQAVSNVVFALSDMNQIGNLYYIILITFILIIIGAIAGITFGNIYLSIVFAIMLATAPFLYIRTQYLEYKVLMLDEMDTALSIITSSIDRTENIVTAIEENLEEIRRPMQIVFQQFLNEVSNSVPREKAIEHMKNKISHPVFIEWCDSLKLVNNDKSLKTSLRPIVNQISEIQIATEESKTILFEVSKESKQITALSIVLMCITYVLLPYGMTMLGFTVDKDFISIIMAIDIFVTFLVSIYGFLITRNMNFENS